MNIEPYRLRTAYRKLKRFVYYDNTNLNLRKSLAAFECDPCFNDRLFAVHDVINSNDALNEPSFQKWLKEINFRIVPKKLNNDDYYICDKASDEGKFISNVTSAKIHKVENVNYFFDGPIELHLIAVLWLMFEGRLLDAQLGKECFGSRLENGLDKPEDDSAVLFRRYHELYAQWRDSGIRKAKQMLVDEKKSVCILGLDIQQYYYRIRLDFPAMAKAIHQAEIEESAILKSATPRNLLKCLEVICVKYRQKIDPFLRITHNDLTPLDTGIPIGLCSSPLLANWYLRNFDKAVKSLVRPAYYGRYVDDILLVLTDTEDPSEEKHPVAAFMDRIFVRTGLLHERNRNEKFYEFVEPRGLFLQQSKCILQYFNAEHSIAGLEKFQKKLEENVSNFILLPVDEAENSLEDVAYELLYEGSVNKFRSVKGMSENRYELAKHLSRQTILHLLTDDPPDPKISLGLRKFFKGKNAIEFHDLWERVLTFFLIADDLKAAKAFTKYLQSEIKRIRFEGEQSITEHLVINLENHLALCLDISGALGDADLQLTKNDQAATRETLRSANLIRHHFVRIPLLNYTTYSGSLITRNVEDQISTDSNKLELSPRYVNFDECLLLAKSGFIKLGRQTAFNWARSIYVAINRREAEGIEWDSIQVNGDKSDG